MDVCKACRAVLYRLHRDLLMDETAYAHDPLVLVLDLDDQGIPQGIHLYTAAAWQLGFLRRTL